MGGSDLRFFVKDQMRIAIDYDGTITRAPSLFQAFIRAAMADGHEIICVTMRSASQPIESIPCEVIYTDCEKKGFFMERSGRHVDVWIDDHPELIF
jgi:hypothetical protein